MNEITEQDFPEPIPNPHGAAAMSERTGQEIAQARDKWLESDEGIKCLDTGILFSPHQSQYLRNRLLRAFEAGATWDFPIPNTEAETP